VKYTAWLRTHKGLGPDAVRSHLAAVRNLHILNGTAFDAGLDPRVQAVRGAANKRSATKERRLPITWEMVRTLHEGLTKESGFKARMFAAALVMGYMGFLRISELCGKKGDRAGLRWGTLSVVDGSLSARLETSKADREMAGVSIAFKAVPGPTCPVKLLGEYLLVRPMTQPGWPLFVFEDGDPMSAVWFRGELKRRCGEQGWRGNFNGHSLRIGAATDAALKGLPGHTIKALGRWKSDAFLVYLRPSSGHLATMAGRLTAD
jgi:integrase